MADVLAEVVPREEVSDDDKQDNDSGIQKDEEKEIEVEEEKKEDQTVTKKKLKIKLRSPKKLQQRNKDGSPKKLPASPIKSPKKRKKRSKQEKEEIIASIVRNENFDQKRSAVK